MTAELAGKVAVITGGGRGLGRATGIEMAKAGARIVVADFHREGQTSAAEEAVTAIKAVGGEAVAVNEDISAMAGAKRIAEAGLDSFGRLDAVCTYAGNFIADGIADLTEEQFDASIAVHLKGTFNAIKAVIPTMLAQKSGRIVTVSSRAGFGGAVPAYAAAKAGIMGLTFAVAGEMARGATGITANCLLPSAYTQLFPSKMLHPALLQGQPNPEPEQLDPADVAPLAAYLATDAAADINGRFFFVGGGEVLVYTQPFAIKTMNNLIRKQGRWSISELSDVLQSIAG